MKPDRRTFCKGIGTMLSGAAVCASVETGSATNRRNLEGTFRSRQVGPSEISIIDAKIPREVFVDESYFVRATVENTSNQSVPIWVTYKFDGLEYLLDDEGLEPSGSTTIDLPAVSAAQIEQDLGRSIDPGTEYTHGIAIFEKSGERPEDRGNLLAERQSSITFTDGSGAGDSTSGGDGETPPLEDEPTTVPRREDPPQGTPTFRPDEAQEAERRERGFLSNSGDEPEFISNPFNLTTLGFLLSVAGIIHQMMGGQ